MQKAAGRIIYSATDIANFIECTHISTLDRQDLDTPLPRTPVDDAVELIQRKGIEHEAAYLARVKKEKKTVIDVQAMGGDNAARAAATLKAMQNGADVIYQATLMNGDLLGFADLLIRVDGPSSFGAWRYEAADTKLAHSTKAKFIVQLAFYSSLLDKLQGAAPAEMHVVLGSNETVRYRCADYSHYCTSLMDRFFAHMKISEPTYPLPCEHCGMCRWRGICEKKWADDDHLSLTANITRLQTSRLEAAGIRTMKQLADIPADRKVDKMAPETLEKLRSQAALQVKARVTGKPDHEILLLDEGGKRGFYRMPKPDDGDMFFDMEGDPWEEGGLEYLFGVYYKDAGKWTFKAFWGHSRAEEKTAFEGFIDYAVDRLEKYPAAHIYHYAPYETTALKSLMSMHASREAEMDDFLRRQKFVDLYRVVREAMRVSEPKYSIKNIEHFYFSGREGGVTNAVDSIVWYEKWRVTKDQKLLDDIARYNEDDVHSTKLLRDWLITLRPGDMPWTRDAAGTDGEDTPVSEFMKEHEARIERYRKALTGELPEDRSTWTADHHRRELVFHLLDFVRRMNKPAFWELYDRRTMTEEEIAEDIACLTGLVQSGDPVPVKRSFVYTYTYPGQDTKIKNGDNCSEVETGRPLRAIVMDDELCTIKIKIGETQDPLPARMNIGPGVPPDAKCITEALFRYADDIIEGGNAYPAVNSILLRSLPSLIGGTGAVVPVHASMPGAAIDAVSRLDSSHLFIQGPPGSGKTYTGSHVIVSLLRAKKRIGVTSNSHKAIHNILDDVVECAGKEGVSFRGLKKGTKGNEGTYYDKGSFVTVFKNDEALEEKYDIIAGTAWLFSDENADQHLDYLFVDEAGQVSLAYLTAIGLSAKNIVLLGDQMQLGQPIQGVHPGRSGDSSLDYLLEGMAVIPAERGIFLENSWRMHPDVCRFISDAVYDSRLEPHPDNVKRVLTLSKDAHPSLRPSGIVFHPITHAGCSQMSKEEAAVIKEIYANALRQRYTDKDGVVHGMTERNILVVAPYNMQVNLLKRTLGKEARVGTVDKFQGQEAEVVIVSMTTSDENELPRHLEFLFSKNRLNVAISRAKCLAIVVANPLLTAIKCTTPEQMALVNTLCWVKTYR
ncbi:MAG: TM0106 family RecB-like putative nuclease [Spirochaetota bacterium]